MLISRLVRTVAAALFAAFLAVPAAAQIHLDLDAEPIEDVWLTEADLLRMETLAVRLDSVFRRNPGAFKVPQVPKATVSLDSAGRILESYPTLGAELARVGMTGREFMGIAWSLLHGAVTSAAQGDIQPEPASALSANIRLVRLNETRVDHIFTIISRIFPD
ncbi:hypothetical protein [Longimicrobium terrae]|uniref:Uncharacterized protein n=1 Tax=Longimicrobium terrae TaxID=1639882 RepID=A0A841H899_9BACT|nr:hypothetical protein [Longimicrobium terrae]MBB4639659.1 hypothetical protein [Longimicrobium terrae]MBB6074056.1 hypothetical protein [Longimicrobium terrae]NNC32651.1 hypothetical protein [Longimicrobium terrae]